MAAFAEPHYDAYQAASFGNTTVFDMVRPEMRELVDPYWSQFPPMNPLWHSILGFVIFVIGLVSMFGNYIVISVFTSSKNLRTPSNFLIVNLALSDFLMMFTMGPPMVYNCMKQTWVLGPLWCQLYAMFGSLFGCVSIWSMTLIAFDRYNVIVKGLSAKPMTKGSVMTKLAVVWLLSAIWVIFPFFGWNRYVPEGNMTACGTDYITKTWSSRSYIFVYAFWVYWTPLLMIIYSYFFILKAVAAHEKSMRDQAKKMNVASLRSSEAQNQSTECKLAKVALVTISLWFMAWTPYLIINFTGTMTNKKMSPLTTIWGSLFAKCSAVYNPIVYAISHPKYQEALGKKYPSLSCSAPPAPSDGASVATEATAEKA